MVFEMKDILLIVLILLNVTQAILHYFERRDMLNRIMSKTFTEYKSVKNSPPKHIPSAHDRVLNKWKDKNGGE